MTCRHSKSVLIVPHPQFTIVECRECRAQKKAASAGGGVEWLRKPYLADGVALSPGFVDRMVFPGIPEELFWSAHD